MGTKHINGGYATDSSTKAPLGKNWQVATDEKDGDRLQQGKKKKKSSFTLKVFWSALQAPLVDQLVMGNAPVTFGRFNQVQLCTLNSPLSRYISICVCFIYSISQSCT